MKKLFTLAMASMLTLSLFAADRRPSVTLRTDSRFEVVIDGRSYGSAIGNTMNVQGMYNGRHTITVYALRNGLFSRQKRMVSSSSFMVNRNDVAIFVDRSGRVDIQEQRSRDNGYGYGNDRGWNQGDSRDSRDNRDNRDNRDRQYDSRGGNRDNRMPDHRF